MNQKTSSKDAILAAAGSVVREQGAAHLTLDAVSAKAQISKGGLLYHFPTKEALLLGMVLRLIELVECRKKTEEVALSDTPGKGLKAYVKAMTAMGDPRVRSVLPALLAAGAQDPKLLEAARESRAKASEEFCKGGLSKEFAAVISLALEGLWILEALGASRRTPEEQQAITDELLSLVSREEAWLMALRRDASPQEDHGQPGN